MKKIDLFTLFTLSDKDAIEYLKAKKLLVSADYKRLSAEIHSKFFTVANAMRLDILKTIRTEISNAIDTGMTLKEFTNNLRPILIKKGWWGKRVTQDDKGNQGIVQLGSAHRLNTIFRTNLTSAYHSGRYKELLLNVDDRPYWQYVAIMDKNTRPSHAMLNGKVFRYDHPFWQTFFPPNGYMCRCTVKALTLAQVEKLGLNIETKMPKNIMPDKGFEINSGEKAWEINETDYAVSDIIAYKKTLKGRNEKD